jgi:uncharacterized protein YecE (DUF72 family)
MQTMSEEFDQIGKFQFHGIHPNVFFGTASDRYAGWLGQIYSEGLYTGRKTRRKKSVGGRSFVEEVLPVESVKEYFHHFRVLELDFTFYRPLLDKKGKATPNFYLLQNYCKHLKNEDRLILKMPQAISAMKLRRGKAFVENEQYLNPHFFTKQFYEPAKDLLGPRLGGLIFEQEYQRKQDRSPPEKFAADLDEFFSAVPKDACYHVELRTKAFLSEPVFSIFEKYGLGQVLSNWTWLPPISRQFVRSDEKILNADKNCIIRLMTPIGMRYADAYAKAHPFNTLVFTCIN